MIRKVFSFLYFFVCASLLFSVTALAYIDPSAMTYIIQIIAGVAIAAGAAFSFYSPVLEKRRIPRSTMRTIRMTTIRALATMRSEALQRRPLRRRFPLQESLLPRLSMQESLLPRLLMQESLRRLLSPGRRRARPFLPAGNLSLPPRRPGRILTTKPEEREGLRRKTESLSACWRRNGETWRS